MYVHIYLVQHLYEASGGSSGVSETSGSFRQDKSVLMVSKRRKTIRTEQAGPPEATQQMLQEPLGPTWRSRVEQRQSKTSRESQSWVSWAIQHVSVSVESLWDRPLSCYCHSASSGNLYFIINCLKCLFLFHVWTPVWTLWEENVSCDLECFMFITFTN